VKGFKLPERVKVPSPVWQLHFEIGSLSQQNPGLPQLRTPASETELKRPVVLLSVPWVSFVFWGLGRGLLTIGAVLWTIRRSPGFVGARTADISSDSTSKRIKT